MRRMQPPDFGDFRDDLRQQDADCSDGMVHGRLAVHNGEGWSLGAESAADPGARLVPDRVGNPHRLRSVLVRPGGERLSGRIEVDETFICGVVASGAKSRWSLWLSKCTSRWASVAVGHGSFRTRR